MKYLIRKSAVSISLTANWDDAVWEKAETLEIRNFRPEGSDHRPQTSARLLYDARGIHGIYRVQDRYVRCERTEYGSDAWKDSCVEFFVQPKPDCGYFNLEMNCGGAFLCWHIIDPTPAPQFFMPPEIGQQIKTRSSLPRTVDPEITEPVTWMLQFFVPFAVYEKMVGPLGEIPGQTWRGNFYKCGDETSHPHWASWSPVDEFNFHLPRCFGEIRFE